eukprot:15483562-Alexandrium_andersonii.AAC.1
MSEPRFPGAGAGGAVLRAVPPVLESTMWGAPKSCRFRAVDRAIWPVGRAGTATSGAGFWGLGQFVDQRAGR